MPTNRRRRVCPRRPEIGAELTMDQEHHLLYGWFFFDDESFPDVESFAQAWHVFRDELMGKVESGYRPFAWWLVEHGKERPIINAWLPPATIEALRSDSPGFRKFSFLHTHMVGGPGLLPLQEPEHDYLRRLKLLTPLEKTLFTSEKRT